MSVDYDEYLTEHINNVQQGLRWFSDNLTGLNRDALDTAISKVSLHDESKYSADEYDAYDTYFYGGNKSPVVKEAFDYAWLHHIHSNPHHWQYWVLINDDASEGTRALEMPLEYVYEMIADWWSFSWKKGDLAEIFNWYKDHKERMILHKNTKKVVEDILSKIGRILVMLEKFSGKDGEDILRHIEALDDDPISTQDKET